MNPKQKKFVQEYLVDLNATQAAIRAGYSSKTAGSMGFDLLKKPEIQAAIQEGQKRLSIKTEISADRVIRELALIAFSDMRSFARWRGDDFRLKDSDELSEAESRCVSEISSTTTKDGGSIRFKLHSKVEALDKLGRHLGLFELARFAHEKEMASLDRSVLKDAIAEIPDLAYFVHSRSGKNDRSTE